MIQDANHKFIIGETISYEKEHAFVKRDRTPVVLTAHPLIFIWGKHPLSQSLDPCQFLYGKKRLHERKRKQPPTSMIPPYPLRYPYRRSWSNLTQRL